MSVPRMPPAPGLLSTTTGWPRASPRCCAAKRATTSVTPPAALAKIPALNAGVTGLLASSEQTSDIIGLRWDFAKSLALKVQIDRVKPGAKSGLLINVPAAGYKKDVTVVAAGVDFVF